MVQLKVTLSEKKKSYLVFIGRKLKKKIVAFIKKKHKNRKIVVITDTNVQKIAAHLLAEINIFSPLIISILPGEKSKSRITKEKIEDLLLDNKYGRDTLIISLGGGVVSDLAGFVASTFCRGIPLIHLPTTLLAMADASIGGKTAINTKQGKNLIGSIHHPDAVFIDLDFLDTLGEEDFLSGIAEIIKTAIIADWSLFSVIKKNRVRILKKDKTLLLSLIEKSIKIKRDIVEKDPEEKAERQMLNFGHTLGHSVEALSGFSIKHGQCVSIGMAVESRIAVKTSALEEDDQKEIVLLLEKIGLPTKIEKNMGSLALIDKMKVDKKNKNQEIRIVLIKRIGKTKSDKKKFSFSVPINIIKKEIEVSKND